MTDGVLEPSCQKVSLFRTFPDKWDSKAPSIGTLLAYVDCRNIQEKFENIPSDTRALALHPSLPIQLNLPVAPILLTAFISSATSWSDAKRITPEIKRNVSY